MNSIWLHAFFLLQSTDATYFSYILKYKINNFLWEYIYPSLTLLSFFWGLNLSSESWELIESFEKSGKLHKETVI